jgi:hypothetical protein
MEHPLGELSRPPLASIRWALRRRRPGSFVALLLLAGTLAASFTLLAVRPPSDASAYDQAYNCETFVGRSTCSLTAGSWYTITNVGGSNYNVAGDICVAFGGVADSTACALGGYSILFCGNSPVHAYGISETYLGDNDNISGHEDNYTSCS